MDLAAAPYTRLLSLVEARAPEATDAVMEILRRLDAKYGASDYVARRHGNPPLGRGGRSEREREGRGDTPIWNSGTQDVGKVGQDQ